MASIDTAQYPRIPIGANYNEVARRGKTDLQRAVEFAKEHREVHLQWIDYYHKHPPQTAAERLVRRHAGGIRHQEIAVRRYDVILRALESANA